MNIKKNRMVVGLLTWVQTLSDSITSVVYHLFVNMTNGSRTHFLQEDVILEWKSWLVNQITHNQVIPVLT